MSIVAGRSCLYMEFHRHKFQSTEIGYVCLCTMNESGSSYNIYQKDRYTQTKNVIYIRNTS
jgi:hypothetical protein